ncbi:MAG: hypothetical protein CVV47_14310 [Spirochaetae bacterium HGW-Spirochaetae-3]|jgi:hypothetical protein|nr:MAG: hypothetical protein CVV47_14310 [Spirochaetae bacterium HGW-Spirochaetae-3]
MIKTSQSRFLHEARTFIENAAGLSEISSVLSAYGYSEARFKKGKELLRAADESTKRKAVEYGERSEAASDFASAWAAANVVYAKTLKLARIALGDDAKSFKALKLVGPRKQSFSGWYDQAGTFYRNLTRDPEFVAKMGAFGYDREKLDREGRCIEEANDKCKAHASESGSAHASTAEYDRKLRELDSWVSDLRAVCEVAFYGAKEELEKLGPLAPIRRRRAGARKKSIATV